MSDEREPVMRDPGDRERLRDLIPQWFRDREHEHHEHERRDEEPGRHD